MPIKMTVFISTDGHETTFGEYLHQTDKTLPLCLQQVNAAAIGCLHQIKLDGKQREVGIRITGGGHE